MDEVWMDQFQKYIRVAGQAKIIALDECKATFRLLICNEEQWVQWLKNFKAATATSWNVKRTFPNCVHYQFRKRYICQHNYARRKNRSENASTKCPAAIDVKIEHMSTKVVKTNSDTMASYLCVVQMYVLHNHGIDFAEAVSHLEPKKMDHVLHYISEDSQAKIIALDECKVNFRLFIDNEEQWVQWLDNFQNATATGWNVRRTYCNGVDYQFRKQYICHHNNVRSSKRVRKDNTNCPAAIKVKIEHMSGGNRANNPVAGYLCVVEMHISHNHGIDSAEALGHLQPNKETKANFYSHFENGLTPCEAIRVNKAEVMAAGGVAALANRRLHPKDRSVYHMWDVYRKEAFGSFLESDMFKAIDKYASTSDATIVFKRFNSHYACAVISPLMKRVHQQIRRSREIIFVDTASNLDQTNCFVTILLCATAIGAMPLGVLVSSSQDEKSYTEAFALMRDTLGACAFDSSGHPAIFMTDDDRAVKNALCNIWPESKQLLCIFDMLQVVQKWLCTAENGIHKKHQQQLLDSFKKIIYSLSEDNVQANFEKLTSCCAEFKYHKFLNYINKMMERRKEWCLYDRSSLITRGHNTNNLCKATLEVFNDMIFNRSKAYNPCMVVQLVAEKLSPYFEKCILNVISNKKKPTSPEEPFITPESITTVSSSIYAVQSAGIEDVVYDVDVDAGVCSCITGSCGELCEHLHSVIIHKHLLSDQLYQGTATEKHRLACVVHGMQNAPKVNFFQQMNMIPTLTSDTTARGDDGASDTNFTSAPSRIRASEDEEEQATHETKTGEEIDKKWDTVFQAVTNNNELLRTSVPSHETLTKLQNNADNDVKSIAQKTSTVHSRSASQARKNDVRKVRVQPSSIARVAEGTARIGKRHRPASSAIFTRKRQRNLATRIQPMQNHNQGWKNKRYRLKSTPGYVFPYLGRNLPPKPCD